MDVRPCRDVARRKIRPIRVRRMAADDDAPDSAPSVTEALTKDVETAGERTGRGDPAWADIVRVCCEIEAGTMLKDQRGAGKQTISGRPLTAVS